MNKKHLIIFGPPGSGKGTQAKKIAQHFKLYYFGTGELMRQEAEKKSELGLLFNNIWDQGKGALVPEELVDKLVKINLSKIDISDGIIFDGYPRTLTQVKKLEDFFLKNNISDYFVLNLVVSDESLIKRLSTRKICPECKKIFQNPIKNNITNCDTCNKKLIMRIEDRPDIIKKRINVYNNETQPIIKYFKMNNKVIDIDGEPSINSVWENIKNILND